MDKLYPEQVEEISHIIFRARHHEEMVLLDDRSAAKNVMQYLHDEGMLKAKVIPLKKRRYNRAHGRINIQ